MAKFTSEEEDILWMRWRSGVSMSDIGRELGRHAATIYAYLLKTGGYTPPNRKRSLHHLSLLEREEISRGLAEGLSLRKIAIRLGRPTSTISREVQRHGRRGNYRAALADQFAYKNARRPKPCKLAENKQLCRIVTEKLESDWSPEQIAGWLKSNYEDECFHISHEAIYRSLFVQSRGVLRRELLDHLRSRRRLRQSRFGNTSGVCRGRIIDGVSISERPAEAEDRAVPGHWEGDLVSGSKNSHIATLVERQSRFALLIKVQGKDTVSVVEALAQHVQTLPEQLRKSLTWDRGMELANHKAFTLATDVEVYFCDPQSPWQRGTNENTNRLVRQYLPRKTDLSGHTQEDLDLIAEKLNTRPRKTLGFKTPAEIFRETVALTG